MWFILLCILGAPLRAPAQFFPAAGGNLAAPAAPGGGNAEFSDPIFGFAVQLPPDWDMATGLSGERMMGINLRTVGSLRAPLVVFFRIPGTIDAAAQALAGYVRAQDKRAQAELRRTGRGSEQEIITTIGSDVLGPVGVYGVAREEAGVVYNLIAMAPMSVAAQFKQEIDRVMGSFHIIGRPILRAFKEPAENAFTLSLPRDWNWEGQIYRDAMCPGAFVWTARAADGSAGAFEIEPGYADVGARIQDALAGDVIPQKLAVRIKGLQDLQLVHVESLPRASEHLSAWFQSILAGTTTIPADRARVHYRARVGNTAVGIRVDTYLNYYPLQVVTGWEASQMSGAWAPEERFDEVFPVARGVRDSLQVDRRWNKLQMDTVAEVLRHRKQVFDAAHDEWLTTIRGERTVTDPDTLQPVPVPDGPGTVYKDPDTGAIFRVPYERRQEVPSKWRELT